MRIMLDINGLFGPSCGITTYINNFLNAIERRDTEDEYLLYAHFFRSAGREKTCRQLRERKRFSLIKTALPERIDAFTQSVLGVSLQERVIRRYQPDIFHGLSNVLPLLRRTKSVVTNHGFLDADRFRQFSFDKQTGSSRYLPASLRSLRDAAHVITVSEWSRREMINGSRLDADRISTVHLGVDQTEGPGSASSRTFVASKYGITRPFVSAVGPVNVKRNILNAMKAFAALIKVHPDSDLAFVIANGKTVADQRYHDTVLAAVHALRLRGRVVFLGNIPAGDMRFLYSASQALMYPSFLEGFGLPVLEAMACNCPVISSRTTCLPEICGDAAILVDPGNIDEMAGALEQVLMDEQARAELIRKGKERIKQFTWDNTFHDTLTVYKKVCAVK